MAAEIPSETSGPTRTALLVVVTALLLFATISMWYAGEAPEPQTGCVPGPVVAYHNTSLTPRLLVNSPFGGTGSGTVPILNDTKLLTIGGPNTNGSTWGYFEHEDWTVQAGEGVAAGVNCQQTFFLSSRDDGASTIFTLNNLSDPYYHNDSEQPTFVNLSWSNGPTYLYNAFYRATSFLSTCGKNTSVQTARSDHLTVGIFFDYGGSTHVVNTTISVNTSYRYVFPANTGVWLIDNLSAPGGPGGGWAFSYLRACS